MAESFATDLIGNILLLCVFDDPSGVEHPAIPRLCGRTGLSFLTSIDGETYTSANGKEQIH